MSIQLLQGDNRVILPTLPPASVQCVITSPPYFGLRDYGVEGQIGGEATPQAYVKTLVGVFDHVWRVLKDDGTVWLNLGDSYANDTKWGGVTGGKHAKGLHGTTGIGRNRTNTGLPSKSLIGIPWRVALALQDAGWTLRCDIIWHKTSCLPESMKDRPTRCHEYIFLLSKQEHYYYNADAIREESAPSSVARARYNNRAPSPKNLQGVDEGVYAGPVSTAKAYGQGRNKRSVWSVAPAQYADAHFATFPERLIEPCILAGSQPGDTVLDPFAGSGTVGRVALKHNRSALLIELNPAYVEQQEQRLDGVQPFLAGLEAA